MASQSKIPLSEMDWGSIGRIFDETETLGTNEIYYFFLDLLSEKAVCKEANCPMFGKLKELNELRREIKYDTIEQARNAIDDEMDFDEVKTSLLRYFSQARDLFATMVQTSTTRQTRIDEEEVYHKRNLELIEAMIKSPKGLDVEFSNTVSSVIKKNSELGEMSERLRKDQEEKEKAAEEREKERKKKEESEV